MKAKGRPKTIFSNPQISEMVRLISKGQGRVTACAMMGVSYKTFQRLIREDADFAAQVNLAEAVRVEACEATLFRIGTKSYDAPVVLRAAVAYLARRERQEAARQARRERSGRGDRTKKAGPPGER